MSDSIVIREVYALVSKVDGDEPILDLVASDETVDRYREVIEAAGWVLDNYRRNPVVLNNHQYYDVTHTLGRAEVTEVRGNMLYQRIRWAVEANPVAAVAYKLYRGGFLRAFSVGFNPIEWVDCGPDEPCRRRYKRQELLEVSAVSIPANPNALALGLASGAVDRSEFDALYDLMTTLRTAPTGDDPTSSGSQAAAAGDGLAAAWVGALERAHRIVCGRAT